MNENRPQPLLPTLFSEETVETLCEARGLLVTLQGVQVALKGVDRVDKWFTEHSKIVYRHFDERSTRLGELLYLNGQANVLRKLHPLTGVKIGNRSGTSAAALLDGISSSLWNWIAICSGCDAVRDRYARKTAGEGGSLFSSQSIWESERDWLSKEFWRFEPLFDDIENAIINEQYAVDERIAQQQAASASHGPGEGHNKPEAEHAEYGHSEDFRSVVFDGVTYEFTTIQAAIVQVLWDEWGNCTPAVSVPTLIERSGSRLSSNRLSDLFREAGPNKSKVYHPAWGAMIIPSKKGAYRLAGICPENLKNPQNPR